ncbi:nucleic acid-binding, OB-fold protein [Artemisia annua]|uniref:Nucleic acid-binding, OB-fold protein n=1 Tax=Artemisia annua TaxID=35608 RepID=A0A2U1Q5G5_ARTAN|nr:nucleic acid-binding, OB-fold protein [Artemisia annua]
MAGLVWEVQWTSLNTWWSLVWEVQWTCLNPWWSSFLRIKIHIRVQDETGSATFCLFQQDVAKLLGKSAGYLISKIDKDEENTSYPTDLEIIVSRQFVFKLQVSAYNVNNNYHIFTVNKLTDDKVVMSLIGSKQTEEEEVIDMWDFAVGLSRQLNG